MDIDKMELTVTSAIEGTDVQSEPPSSQTIQFLKSHSVPADLTEFLLRFSFTKAFKINHVYFHRLNDIAEENLVEENRACIENGLLIIGCGLNGDPIFVDIESKSVGFVFHDELWESENPEVSDVIVDMQVDIAEFYDHSLNKRDYPVDAYAAEEFMKKSES